MSKDFTEGAERPPYKWELQERGLSSVEIKKILSPYSDGRISLLNLMMITTIMSVLLASLCFLVLGIGLHYYPSNKGFYYRWMLGSIAMSLLPVIFLALSNYLQNIFGKLLLIIAVAIGLCWGAVGLWYTFTDPGDFLLYVSGIIYCVMIVLSALKIRGKLSKILE